MESPRRAPVTSRGPRPVPRHAQRRALIVDDDDDFAELVAFWFRTAGWAVDVAEDGVQALTLLGNKRVDLLVADLQMSGMNGWELLRHVHSRWGCDLGVPHPPTRIVVISGRTDDDVDSFARGLGADAFFPKPVDRHTLLNTVATLFTQTRETQAPSTTQRRQP